MTLSGTENYITAGSFKEMLIYYKTTIEWSLESLAEQAIKGNPKQSLFPVSGNGKWLPQTSVFSEDSKGIL